MSIETANKISCHCIVDCFHRNCEFCLVQVMLWTMTKIKYYKDEYKSFAYLNPRHSSQHLLPLNIDFVLLFLFSASILFKRIGNIKITVLNIRICLESHSKQFWKLLKWISYILEKLLLRLLLQIEHWTPVISKHLFYNESILANYELFY